MHFHIWNFFKKLRIYLFFIFSSLIILLEAKSLVAQPYPLNLNGNQIKKAELWADSVLKTLSREEKIGQLLMISAYSGEKENRKDVEWAIKKYKIGGLIFFKGYPVHQLKLTNHYQQMSSVPLLIAIDAEWGVGMRLDSVITFPKQMTYGFADDSILMYETGKAIAQQCRNLGIHINFAPDIDINSNARNPVIHLRSFGENKYLVTRLGLAYMKGLQDNGILAVAKHFPGHGDTDKDSHLDLPVLFHNTDRLNDIELYPFRNLINMGVGGVMSAHLRIPAFDSTPVMPGSLSPLIVNKLLKDELGFKGLVFTDALNMKGVSAFYSAGDIELMALLAGNDILLCPQSVSKAVNTIDKAIKNGLYSDSLLDLKVRKILIYKYLLVSPEPVPLSPSGLQYRLNAPEYYWLKQQVIERSITLLKNDEKLIPVRGNEMNDYFTVYVGFMKPSVFQSTLELYGNFPAIYINDLSDTCLFDSLLLLLMQKKRLIFVLAGTTSNNINHAWLSQRQIEFVNFFLDNHLSVLVNLGSPYLIDKFSKAKNILQVTENDSLFQFFGAQALMGAFPVTAKNPVSINQNFPYGSGLIQNEILRLKYTSPFDIGIKPEKLNIIDSLIHKAIDLGVFPGCQVMLVKEQKVFFFKSYGYHTYDKVIRVKNNDIYDLASLTKVSATLLPLMRLYESGILKLDARIRKYIELPAGSGYAKATIAQILTHEAGFDAWIPFYEYFLDKNHQPDSFYFSNVRSERFNVQVSDNLYAINDIEDRIWKIILEHPLKKTGVYLYSDLDFIFLKKLIDNIIQQPFSEYLEENFYLSLGMNNTMFNPAQKVFLDRIPPTEIDNYFRNTIIQAYVHDPAAALLGGIAGHAGLFSNANDLAKLFQMFLNHGVYGGQRYFSPQTIDTFTRRYSNISRRALGFDKPETVKGEYNPCSDNTPPSAFGHTGFTGTCIWADPDHQLIFIFLSNRTYPDQNNKLINQLRIRQELQKLIYEIVDQK